MTAVEALVLQTGAHASPEKGACLMEAVSWVAGERWSDHPECACPVLAAFGRALNDRLPDDLRQHLLPYTLRLVGTRADRAIERRRAFRLADWSIRTVLPWLARRLKAEALAEQCAALPPITDAASARAARDHVNALREELRAAADAADADAAAAAADAAADTAAHAAADAAAAASAAADTAADAAAAADAADAAAHAAADAASAAHADAAWRRAKREAWSSLLPEIRALLDELLAMGPKQEIPLQADVVARVEAALARLEPAA